MKLREFERKDAPYMLEWMHDEVQIEFLQANFLEKKLSDCEAFIEYSLVDKENKNWAICDDKDEYLGTISLKHIDKVNGNAEYAISMRRCATGTGASSYGTEEILRIAFEELGLNKVYLNVLADNIRANKFYAKMGFVCEGTFKEHLFINEKYHDLKWFAITRKEYFNRVMY